MKIAYLSSFFPYRGGIAQFNGALYRALEKEHEICAFTFSRQYPNLLFPGKTQLVAETDTADKIPSIRSLDSINPFTYYSTAKKIIDFKPDLLILKFWIPFLAPAMGYVARKVRKTGVPVISVLGNVISHEPRIGDEILTKFYLNQVDGFVAMANEVKDDLLKLKPDAKYIYHPHPNYMHFGNKIDSDTAKEILKLPKNKKILLFFGLIRKYKGLDILLEAFASLPDDYFLLIAGEVYADLDIYTNIISKYNLQNRIQFHNRYISDDEVKIFFSAADVCTLPYRTATQSGIVGVSYNFDVPVISTDVGGLKEVIEPYKCGIVIEKTDSDLLKSAILKYFNENLKSIYIENIIKSKKFFSWDNLAAEISKFANEIKSEK